MEFLVRYYLQHVVGRVGTEQYYSVIYSLDSIHKILSISHVSASIIKMRVVSNSYHPSFLAQSWETPTSD